MQITSQIFKWDFFEDFAEMFYSILRREKVRGKKKKILSRNPEQGRRFFLTLSFKPELHPYVGHEVGISS